MRVRLVKRNLKKKKIFSQMQPLIFEYLSIFQDCGINMQFANYILFVHEAIFCICPANGGYQRIMLRLKALLCAETHEAHPAFWGNFRLFLHVSVAVYFPFSFPFNVRITARIFVL